MADRAAFRISIIYLVFGSGWIVISDRLTAAISPNAQWLTHFQTLKGWVFIWGTALLLYFLSRRVIAALVETRKARDQLEDTAFQSEQRFRCVFDQLPLAVQGFDPDFTVRYWNKASERLYGYRSEEAIGRPVSELTVAEEDWQAFADILGKLRRDELDSYSGEFSACTKTGARVPILSKMVVAREGGREEVFCLDLDLTEIKRARESLQESEERYKTIFHQGRNAVLIADAQGHCVDCNASTLELFRCTPAEIIGKTGMAFSPLFQADGRESAVVFAEVFDGASRGVKDLDWRYQRTDGSLLDTETTIAWVTLAGHPHIITFIRDITASRMAAQALKRSEQRFRTIFENAAVGIAIADNSGRYVQFNDRFREMLGYSAKELGALTNTDVTHPEDVPRSKEKLARVMRGECHSYQMEKRFLRKSGEAFWAFLSVGAIRDVASDVPLAVGVVVDINEAKRMQERQKRLEKHMLQSQKAEALGTMAGGIAHDFNNILFGILGYTEMALSDIDPHHAAREYLDSVREAALRSRELVQQILAFSRQAEASPEAIQPRIIVKEVLTLLRASLPSTIQIHTIMPSEAFIHGDPGQLHQVIMNLCTNAGHAMEEAGGRLSIGLHDREVDSLQAERCPGVAPGKYVQLTVADTGKGIPSAIQEKIFDPYFTTKPKGKGTGMGLAMVQGIVRQMGGAVSVGSQEGAGTTFKVLLPVIEHHGRAAPPEIAVPRRGSGHILFVDDEEILYHLGDRLLQRLGYKVTAFQDSHEALLAFSACPGDFDLVITDFTMPRMNGLQLTEKIKALRPEIPVILATGYSEPLTESRARHMGVQCILRKPVTMMELSKHVSQALPGNRDSRSEEGSPE